MKMSVRLSRRMEGKKKKYKHLVLTRELDLTLLQNPNLDPNLHFASRLLRAWLKMCSQINRDSGKPSYDG